jgi:hypothetical protein
MGCTAIERERERERERSYISAQLQASHSRIVFRNLFLLAAHHKVSMTQQGTQKCYSPQKRMISDN